MYVQNVVKLRNKGLIRRIIIVVKIEEGDTVLRVHNPNQLFIIEGNLEVAFRAVIRAPPLQKNLS